MSRKAIHLIAGVLLAAAAIGCSTSAPRRAASNEATSAAPTPAATTTPTISPSPSPDRVADARAIVEALGGDPTGEAQIGTEEFQSGLIWPSVKIDDGWSARWTIAWSYDGQVAYLFSEAAVYSTTPPLSLTKAEAIARARAVLETLKIQASGEPEASLDPLHAWSVVWPRTVDGVPVNLDYVAVYFNASGELTQYTRIWRQLAPKPEKMLTAQEALAKLDQCGPASSTASLCEKPHLEWYQPTEDPQPLRLCWMIGTGHVGAIWGLFAVDAGTGEIFDESVAGPF